MSAAEIVPSYAAAGLPVLPLHAMRGGCCTCGRPAGTGPADCHSPAKHPLTRNGKDDASTDLGVIAEWLARWPGCNWGVRPPAGVVVLDVDPRNAGDVTLDTLQGKHGRLPATLTARTGSGGQHIWLTHNGPARGRLGDGIDVKTNSGYLVAPPSVHACGGHYEWIDQRSAAYAPRWVALILNPPRPRYAGQPGKGAGLDALVRWVGESPEGQGNNRLYWAACRAHESGLDVEPLIDAAVGRGTPHMEAVATARSAEHAPARKAVR